MLTVKIGNLVDEIGPTVEADIPVFVHGWTGIGKTEIISGPLMAYLERRLGPCVLHEFRMSTHDPVDGSGIPIVNKEDMSTQWTRPGFIMPDDGRTHVIYWGEVGHLNPAQQHILYGATKERCLSGYYFPKKNRQILDLNTREDKGGDIKLVPPFMNRGAHYFAELDHAGWIEYQIRRGMDPRLIAFNKLRPNLLHYMMNRDKDNRIVEPTGPSFPTPRSIERIDKYFKMGLPDAQIVKGAQANCGEGYATDLATFLKDLGAGLPKLSEIRANPTTAKVPDELNHQYVIAAAISHSIDKASADTWAKYLARLTPDIASMAAHNAMQRDASLKGLQSLKDLVL